MNRRAFKQDIKGFTLVEIMIVVAIIGLLAALAIPTFIKNRKQSQGRRILNDCRQMDSAIDEWSVNNGIADGTAVDTVAAGTYLKRAWITTDLLNNSYALNPTGTTQIQINVATKSALDGCGIDWGIY
jgi:prepilin-type N-terminal cleavage/methylation domain-containing protein